MPRIQPAQIPNPAPGAPSTSMYAHAPTILEGTRALDAGITAAGRISPQLRRLMNVKAASMVGCPF
jgi:hypothetical protein